MACMEWWWRRGEGVCVGFRWGRVGWQGVVFRGLAAVSSLALLLATRPLL
jgi:hypothetical protein